MLTREEVVARCARLSDRTKYAAEPWEMWLAEMLAHDADQRQEISRLREALQVLSDVQKD